MYALVGMVKIIEIWQVFENEFWYIEKDPDSLEMKIKLKM